MQISLTKRGGDDTLIAKRQRVLYLFITTKQPGMSVNCLLCPTKSISAERPISLNISNDILNSTNGVIIPTKIPLKYLNGSNYNPESIRRANLCAINL